MGFRGVRVGLFATLVRFRAFHAEHAAFHAVWNIVSLAHSSTWPSEVEGYRRWV